MVDFNSGETIGKPAVDVVKISILQRRYDFIEAYEDYKKKRFSGVAVPLSIVQARLISLFLELQACVKRRFKLKDYNEIKEICFKARPSEKELLNIFYTINKDLDRMNLTKIDRDKVYNALSVEEENKMKGY